MSKFSKRLEKIELCGSIYPGKRIRSEGLLRDILETLGRLEKGKSNFCKFCPDKEGYGISDF